MVYGWRKELWESRSYVVVYKVFVLGLKVIFVFLIYQSKFKILWLMDFEEEDEVQKLEQDIQEYIYLSRI